MNDWESLQDCCGLLRVFIGHTSKEQTSLLSFFPLRNKQPVLLLQMNRNAAFRLYQKTFFYFILLCNVRVSRRGVIWLEGSSLTYVSKICLFWSCWQEIGFINTCVLSGNGQKTSQCNWDNFHWSAFNLIIRICKNSILILMCETGVRSFSTCSVEWCGECVVITLGAT